MKYLKITTFVLLSLLITIPVYSLDVPKRTDRYVNDYADMLNPQTEFQLEQALNQYEAKTSNQVMIVTFPSLEGESLEDFSIC